MTLPEIALDLCGQRFSVVYRLIGGEVEARAKAHDICLEQTVEFPEELVPNGDIRRCIVGRVESFARVDTRQYEATISFAVEISGYELVQLLNVAFGNISMKPGIRLERLELPEKLLQGFKGPRFGLLGLRDLLSEPERPLICTALKPMGLSARSLAELAYQFALGGIDIIKDDHGLANQSFAPYSERVLLCTQAVHRANQQTGLRSIYVPSVTGPADAMVERALFAKEAGAGGLLVAPGLTGFDAMRQLADDDRIALPIISHPALQGSFVTKPDSGVSHYALFGQIARLAGADATVYPNYGGRFSFSREECRSIVSGAVVPMAHIKTIFPTPGGGMSLEQLAEMLQFYGRDVILLIGGGLYRDSSALVLNCRALLQQVH